ncbi:hypothetical protein Clacol_005259 [Clathrus columnatus]|uniref:Uncharacterized protein n=1 Tax=Clathrus columnatus TaxID=1419009 RepID=A0AAV5AC21_9AGAM|nr:hypothetical protein Clacol_005259 [Clathrus columnatus]
MSVSETFRVSQWAPANETENDLIDERLALNGPVIGAVAYGGPLAYLSVHYGVPINVTGFVAYVVNAWLQDGLLLYRFFIIFDHNYWIALIPGGLYTVSIIMSSLMLAQINNPSVGFFSHTSVDFALTFWSISIGTTLLLTALIVLRLMYRKYQVRKAFLNTPTKTPYLSVSATLAESAFLYSVVGLIFIITYARNSPVVNLFLPLLGQVQSIAPLFILLRVAQQRAWTRDTLKSTDARVDFVTILLTSQTDSSGTPHASPLTTASKVNLPNSGFSDSVFQDAFTPSRQIV